MKAAIHPRLVEDAVFLACRAAAARGDESPGEWLHRALERAYRVPAGPERDLRFERAHAVAFRRLGLSAALFEVLAAHPGLARADGPVRIGPAPGRAKEGMDLHERREVDGRRSRSAVASVLPATLAVPAALAARLHRDAAKVADMLDPAFGWSEDDPEPTPARRESVRLRYGAAWNAWTDGRLRRRGLPSPDDGDSAERDFAAVFAGALGDAGAAAAWRALREAPSLAHGDLLRYARDPSTLPGAGAGCPAGRAPAEGLPAPGSPCPLCRFPTHDWVPEPASLPEAALAGARASEPSWTPERGICGQCALLYASRATA